MKTTRTFNGHWFLFAVVGAIVIGEVAVWKLAELYGLRISPITVGVVCTGIVAAVTSVLYEGVDIG